MREPATKTPALTSQNQVQRGLGEKLNPLNWFKGDEDQSASGKQSKTTMYAQKSDAMLNLRNPYEIHISFPDETKGRIVFVDELEIFDLFEFADETKVGDPDATVEGEESAEGQDDAKESGEGETDQGSGSQAAIQANSTAESSSGSKISVLMQKMPMNSSEEVSNNVYVVHMNQSAFSRFTQQATIAPDTSTEVALDIDEIARQVYDDVKEQLEYERERLQTMA